MYAVEVCISFDGHILYKEDCMVFKKETESLFHFDPDRIFCRNEKIKSLID
jgi:hypothetical protein